MLVHQMSLQGLNQRAVSESIKEEIKAYEYCAPNLSFTIFKNSNSAFQYDVKLVASFTFFEYFLSFTYRLDSHHTAYVS